jgi:2-polyprenyl-6-hydroxyphenyl methylase/3-demethylubiquinone-9 3-methyltransferase
MAGYYESRLSASSLRRCYEIASPRVRQYLDAEIGYVVSRVAPGDILLDAGCGYGRAVPAFAAVARFVVGIDTSAGSLAAAAVDLAALPNCLFARMDATALAFTDDSFDVVACIQNGASAFHVDLHVLVAELLRVTRPGGLVLVSTYSDGFWGERLAWFRAQAEAGLIGPIDDARTGDGVIVCEDGFAAGTVSPAAVAEAASGLDADMVTVEVDASSLFFELTRRA